MLSRLGTVDQADDCGEHTSFSFANLKHTLVVCKLSHFKNVDQASACGENASFSFESVSSMRFSESASFLVLKVFRVFQACACC